MNGNQHLEDHLRAWLEEEAAGSFPGWALAETMEHTRSRRQAGGWQAWLGASRSHPGRLNGLSGQRRTRSMIMSAAAASIVVAVGIGIGVVSQEAEGPGPGPGHASVVVQEPGEWIVFEHFGQAPDGSTTEMDFDRRQVWLVRPDGSGLHELAPGRPTDGKTSPDVSPDGGRVAFSSWAPTSLIYEVGIDEATPTLLSSDCSGLPEECQEWDPAFAPDGSRIAFVRMDAMAGGSTRIGIRDLASGEVEYLDETAVPLEDGWLNQPSWSPDGSQIAYHRATERGDAYPSPIRIWIADVDGGGVQELQTPDGEDAADPDWSPDHSRIVYSTMGFRESEGRSGIKPVIYTISPDGTGLAELCDGYLDPGCWAPTWMPGGEEILYWGNQTWFLMAADGSNKRLADQGARLRYFGDQLGYGYSAVWQPRPVTEP